MKPKVIETSEYAGALNVDYQELQKLADDMVEEELESPTYVISYARVSTPKQKDGWSLEAQHRSNVMQIRDMCDNPIMFVTEIGSGAVAARERLLYSVISDFPNLFTLFCAEVSRFSRSLKAGIDIAELMRKRGMCLCVGLPEFGYIWLNGDSIISQLMALSRRPSSRAAIAEACKHILATSEKTTPRNAEKGGENAAIDATSEKTMPRKKK